MDGYEFTVERNKLLVWLAREKDRAAELEPASREARWRELEADFDRRMADLYAQARNLFEPQPGKEGSGVGQK